MNNKLLVIALVIVVGLGLVFIGSLLSGNKTIETIKETVGSVTSPYSVGPEFCINGLCEYVAAANFKDATTTIVSFANPYTAGTSTIDFVQLYNTGVATSTYTLICGPTYLAGATPVDVTAMIYTANIATSTNFGTIVSSSASVGYKFQGMNTTTTASSSVAFGKDQYFVCKAAAQTGSGESFSGPTNTFDGNFKVKIIRGY